MCERRRMEQLQNYLVRKGVRPSELAKEVGTSRGYMHDIINRRRRPGLRVAAAIERATGGAVPASSWASQPPGGSA